MQPAKPVAGGGSDALARTAFESGLREVAATILAGPKSPALPRDLDAACAALASLVGAVTLARDVGSDAMAEQIADATGRVLLGAGWES